MEAPHAWGHMVTSWIDYIIIRLGMVEVTFPLYGARMRLTQSHVDLLEASKRPRGCDAMAKRRKSYSVAWTVTWREHG